MAKKSMKIVRNLSESLNNFFEYDRNVNTRSPNKGNGWLKKRKRGFPVYFLFSFPAFYPPEGGQGKMR